MLCRIESGSDEEFTGCSALILGRPCRYLYSVLYDSLYSFMLSGAIRFSVQFNTLLTIRGREIRLNEQVGNSMLMFEIQDCFFKKSMA